MTEWYDPTYPFDSWTGRLLPGFLRVAEYDPEKGGPTYRHFMKQPGKILKMQGGPEFLEYLKNLGEEVDPLIPWLANQFKVGNIRVGENFDPTGGSMILFSGGDFIGAANMNTIKGWADWYNAKDHPTRRGVNVQDKDFDVEAMASEAKEHQEALKNEKFIERFKNNDATVVRQLTNGWTIRQLSGSDLEDESYVLGHCIGTDEKYRYWLDNDNITVYSLRDENGVPRLTWHLNEDGGLAHIQGSSGGLDDGDEMNAITGENNGNIKPEYIQMAFGGSALVPGESNPFADFMDEDGDATIYGEEQYDEEEEEPPEPTLLSEYEHFIEDADNLTYFLEMGDPTAYVYEMAQEYVDMSNADNEPEDQYYVDNDTDLSVNVYWQYLVQEMVREEMGSPEERPDQEALFGPFEYSEGKGMSGRNPWNNSQKPESLNALFDALDEAIDSGWEFNNYTTAEDMAQELSSAIHNYRPQSNGQQEMEAIGKLKAKWDEYAKGYTLPEDDGPIWQEYNRYQDWAALQENSPTLWQESQGPEEHYPLEKPETFLNPDRPPVRAVPWHDPTIDPDATATEKVDIEMGFKPRPPDPFNRPLQPVSAWNQYTEDYLRDYLYDPWTGKRLPGTRTASVEGAGPLLRRILKQPGKKLETPEGKRFLEWIAEQGEDLDPLAPWLVNQFKRGNIQCGPLENDIPLAYGNEYANINIDNLWPEWAEWYSAREHPTRRGVNIEDPDFDIEAMRDAVQAHQAALAEELELQGKREQYSNDGSEVVYSFPNGFTVNQLKTTEHLEGEGDELNHCIGNPEQPYCDALNEDRIEVFSLRDPDGIPKATWHYEGDELGEVQGASGRPKDEYMDMIEHWATTEGRSTNPTGSAPEGGADAEYEVRIDDIGLFLTLENGEYRDVAYEDNNANIGEETDIHATVDRNAVLNDLIRSGPMAWDWTHRSNVPNWNLLLECIKADGISEWDALITRYDREGELDSRPDYGSDHPVEGDTSNDWGPKIKEWWAGVRNEFIDPYGETQEPDFSMGVYDPSMTPLQRWKDQNMKPLWSEAPAQVDVQYDMSSPWHGLDPSFQNEPATMDSVRYAPWSEDKSEPSLDDQVWTDVMGNPMEADVFSPTGIAQPQTLVDRIQQKNRRYYSPITDIRPR
jgi:hypothetical protein